MRFPKLPIACVFAVAASSLTTSAEAGLLDFLFGPRRPAPVYYAPQAYAPAYRPPAYRPPYRPQGERTRVWIDESEHAKRSLRRSIPEEGSSDNGDTPRPESIRNAEKVRELYDVARDKGFAAAFLQDPTLRGGDIVVTQTGLEVFEGGGEKKRRNQFRPLSRSRLHGRADLAALQRASGFEGGVVESQFVEAARPLTITRTRKTARKSD